MPPPPRPRRRPFLVGLTGSIGMGKSAVSAMLRAEGVPVWDADEAVHELYSPGGAAVAAVAGLFPGDGSGPATVVDPSTGGIDRAALGRRVLGDPAALARLEAAVHPLVASHRNRFVERAAGRGEPLVVLDVPLLFETGLQVKTSAAESSLRFTPAAALF